MRAWLQGRQIGSGARGEAVEKACAAAEDVKRSSADSGGR